MNNFESATKLASVDPSAVDISPEYFDHIKKINDVFYDQINISDQKAAYIFTFVLALLVSSSDVRGVFTWGRYANGNLESILCSGLLAGASVFSILAAILVVLPRHVNKSTSLFWGTWGKHRPVFFDAAMRRDELYLFNEYLDNADILSTIARGKYRCATIAFRALMVTVIAYVMMLVAV